ncbi:SMR family transporter [Shewanella schlegeliana]|uniref:QacE family quaternary ammonium compound efflux SMR transporter n=1 Tax=Shewanella schlegeliana TaxID=190308 RepID=A0ABS1SY05_9GAMM|nr:SMR family transporter [Shewanella schlegeliana]MBL4913284.1 QacE family quaternary ammonium compound efflux SMR transporter [Shewanella schlegeliana]MCL1109239.1 SMR family transporter [Shewanella schlegeliana]GIU24514.1 multidrug transporter [Shewanella schlegeliana]
MNSYFYLSLAIVSEVIATSLLPVTMGVSRLLPSIGCGVGYGAAFYFLSLATNSIPTHVAYAIWCGAGIVLITMLGIFMGKMPNLDTIFGMILIVIGVALINMNSPSLH